MSWKTYPFYIFVFTIAIICKIHPSTSVEVGAPCSTEKDCQSLSILLTCGESDSKCICIDDPDVKLDVEHQQCVVQEESSCYREGPESDNKFQYVPCIKNAECGFLSKVCECKNGFYSAGNGSCIPQKQYGQPCSPKSNLTECDIFRVLTCKEDETCGCGPGLQYHSKLDTCFRPLNSPCSRQNYFYNELFPGRYDSCPLQAECYAGICLCRPGFRASRDGNCHMDYGQRCAASEPCSDIQFTCRNGTCQCKYPLHQIYDSMTKECLSVVPGPCEEGLIGCVPLAKCVEGQCRCEDRYRQSPLGHCVKPHGYDCELDGECDNTMTALACINNVCSCPDELQMFDRETESCLGLVGARCPLTFESRLGARNSSCVDGAECVAYGSKEKYGEYGECLSGNDSTETENGAGDD